MYLLYKINGKSQNDLPFDIVGQGLAPAFVWICCLGQQDDF